MDSRGATIALFTACVCATIGATDGRAAAPDIVLYATDATNLRGNWSRIADATAAGEQLLASTDRSWSNNGGALAAPADSVDFTFSAATATAYHVWVRMRAAGNSKFNDSVYLQFSDAIDANGGSVYRLGTTSGLTVNLARDGSGKGLSGWGWQDRAYWLTQTTTLRFTASGTHTLRVQTREDGVQIDQIVLSPATYLTAAPGPLANDTTIVAKPVVVALPSLPSPWTTQDVGATGLAGTSSYANGVFTVAGAGDIAGTADAFRIVSQTINGDTRVVARVTTVQNTNAYAKAGVMLRESLAGDAAHVVLDVRPNGAIEFMTRPTTGAATSYIAGATQTVPVWLKLERVGGTVTGAFSADGAVWTSVGSAATTMATAATAGLVVTSHDTTALNTSTFDNVAVSVPVPPPSAPTSPAPAANATGVSTSASLAWSAAGATSYDVSFGVTNPPSLVASGITTASFTPGALAAGMTYYWQVVARNGSGAAAGPVWSFTTQVAPPAVPTNLTPPNGTTNVATTPTLGWTAAGATSYDVRFGPTNPPSLVARGVPSATYTPPTLANATTYFWQVTANNSGGSTAGPVSAFTTIAASQTTQVGVSPIVYNAITDRYPHAKPPVPLLGAAGFTFNDPAFGSKILRVTDRSTRPGVVDRSYRVPSNAHLAAWNASSTAFFVISNDGTAIPYAFDAATMTASRIQPSGSGNGGLTLGFYVEPQFSLANPNLIYGAVTGANGRTISIYDFSTGAYTTVVNLDTLVSGLSGYVGGLMTGGTTPEMLMTFFGGGSQDRHFYVLWTPAGDLSARKVLDTHASTINGRPANVTLNFNIHSAQIDKSGRYVFVYPTSVDLASPRYASQVYIWDTQTDAIVPVTNGANGTQDMHPGGHDAAGYGYWVNQDCCTSSSWDAMQWQFRYLSDPTRTNDLISPVLSPKEIYAADHTTWNNARPDAMVPVISSTYRTPNNTTEWRAWDDEIIGVDTTGGIGGVVYRFAHHRSNIASDTDPTSLYFWYEPIANVSPDGRWVLFTSNWEKTLGRDASEGTFRQDVFVVQLTPQ